MKSLLFLTSVALLLTGCEAAIRPTPEQLATATYSEAPQEEMIEAAIKTWADATLKDPDSMKLKITSRVTTQGYAARCVEFDGTFCHKRMFYFGHILRAEINAKNTYGGYTGYEPYVFVFRGNVVSAGFKGN